MIALAIVYVGLTIPPYIVNQLNGEYFVDDARQWAWPFWSLLDPLQYPADFYARYFIDVTPVGFVGLIESLMAFGGDPDTIFPPLGVASLVACALFLAIAAWRIGGPTVGFATLAVVFAIDAFAVATAGGLPRSVGCAITALAVLGYVARWPWATALAAVLGGWLWYPAAIMAGGLFGLQLLAPAVLLGDERRRSLMTRIAIVALVAVATSGPALNELRADRYGALIEASDPDWPEAGPDGRLGQTSMLGPTQPVVLAARVASRTLTSDSNLIQAQEPRWRKVRLAIALATIGGVGVVLLILSLRDMAARRVLAVMGAGVGLYALAVLVAPIFFAPARYLNYLLAMGAAIGLPYALYNVPRALPFLARLIPSRGMALLLGLVALLVLSFGRHVDTALKPRPGADQREVLAFASQSEPGTLFAGWMRGVIDNVPLYARRPVLLSFELHVPYKTEMAQEMRERANALIDAWYATEAGPLLALGEEYGVDYFIVDRERVRDAHYFKPYDARIIAALDGLGDAPTFLEAIPEEAKVMENEGYAVISLDALARARGSEGMRAPAQ